MQDQLNKRKREILLAALDCFAEHGVESSTIEMIREASGASVGSLYHHFKSKEHIAASIYLEGIREHNARLNAALGQGLSAEQGIKTMVRVYVGWVSENPAWAKFIFHNGGVLKDSPLREQLEADNQANFLIWSQWITAKVAEGRIQALPGELYLSLIIGAAQSYARVWLGGSKGKDLLECSGVFEAAAWAAVGVHSPA